MFEVSHECFPFFPAAPAAQDVPAGNRSFVGREVWQHAVMDDDGCPNLSPDEKKFVLEESAERGKMHECITGGGSV